MLKRTKTNIRKIVTFAKFGIDKIRADTNFRILGIAFIDLKGLMTRNVRSAFKFNWPGKNSKIPVITTKKSITFHPSRRYDFSCIANPIAMILTTDSRVKTIVNATPTLSRTWFHYVRESLSE